METTMMGTVFDDNGVEVGTVNPPEQQQQPTEQIQTTQAPPATPPSELSLALNALQTANARNEMLEKRLNDQRSWFDKRFAKLEQSLSQRANTPQPEDWQNTITDPERMKKFVQESAQQVEPTGSNLSEADIAQIKVRNTIEKFQSDNAKHLGNPAIAKLVYAIASKQVDDPRTQVTERILKGALDSVLELIDASSTTNGNSGNQQAAGSNTGGQQSSQAGTSDASGNGNTAPINISGSGMSGSASPKKPTTMADLKQLLRRVDWSKTE